MALPLGTTGSLGPAFAPARLVGLAVKRASALTLVARFPTVLSPPSSASVTFWEATAPVKLPTCNYTRAGSRAKVSTPPHFGAGLNGGPTDIGATAFIAAAYLAKAASDALRMAP